MSEIIVASHGYHDSILNPFLLDFHGLLFLFIVDHCGVHCWNHCAPPALGRARLANEPGKCLQPLTLQSQSRPYSEILNTEVGQCGVDGLI